ncbi:MAG: proline dehydrogenase family protein [Jatrophihabitans sp.]|uniref:proline dehydrogenase family protein n=1 Tax=Jatrophihabitans sp. TaxID=1932789 RepID=UPI003F8088E0
MMRSAILAASRSARLQAMISRAPVTRGVVQRFVAGDDTAAAVAATRTLTVEGLTVSLDHLGEDPTDRAQAEHATAAYLELLSALERDGLTERLGPLSARVEVSVKLSAVGQVLPGDGAALALDHAREICAAAERVGATVTLDMEDHTTTDATLETLADLRKDFPATGAVLQAYLRRTEADARDLAVAGSRVRLCKGAYDEPASVAFRGRADVDASYRRCLDVLLHGDGYPMIATHDPAMITAAQQLITATGRTHDSYEFQMLYGVRPQEQQRLAGQGHVVRTYVPYGAQWYGYLMRRLAERPANLTFFARSVVSKG